jgi:hypothetical protein
VHRVGSETLVACCDKNILGSTLKDDELEVHVNDGFYGGETVGEDELVELMRGATIANLMGDRVVELAIQHGFVDRDNVADVCGVKHAQVFTIE